MEEVEQRVNECEGRNRGLCATNEERGAEAILGVVYSNEKVDSVAPLAFDAAGSFNAESLCDVWGGSVNFFNKKVTPVCVCV